MRGDHRPRRRIHPLVQPQGNQPVTGMEKPDRMQNKPGAGRIGKQLQENVHNSSLWLHLTVTKQSKELAPTEDDVLHDTGETFNVAQYWPIIITDFKSW